MTRIRIIFALVGISAAGCGDVFEAPGHGSCVRPQAVEGAFAFFGRFGGFAGHMDRYFLTGGGDIWTTAQGSYDLNFCRLSEAITPTELATLRKELDATGVYQLEPGCYTYENDDLVYDGMGSEVILYFGETYIRAYDSTGGAEPELSSAWGLLRQLVDALPAEARRLETECVTIY